MTRQSCTVPECTRPLRARGLCGLHYQRLLRKGSVGPADYLSQPGRICSVADCGHPARSSRNQYCEMHYGRYRRGAPMDTPRRAAWGALCPIDGCDNPTSERGLCSKHAYRVRRHGDPSAYTPHSERNFPKGNANPKWTGEAVTYYGMHRRVRAVKGRASSYPCVGCGKPARHWSYDHADPDERQSELGPYSISADHYVPRCVSCHKHLDLAQKPRQRRTHVDLDRVRQLHAQDMRAAAIARQLGVSRNRIAAAFDDLGLAHFQKGGVTVRTADGGFAPAGGEAR
jgi:hypothetical protein